MNIIVSPRGVIVEVRYPRVRRNYDPIEAAIARHGCYYYPTTSGSQRRMERISEQQRERERR